jgi:bifunctional DNA-binding transcriptional regulator/antitoxin component of YhaV-PrlF toxin-antitoxin module
MRIGERGQVTIPKRLREEYGLTQDVEVDFVALPDGIKIVKRVDRDERFARARGLLKGRALNENVDEYIEEIRGR